MSMLTLGSLYLVSLILISIISIVMLKKSGYLAVAVKGALGSVGALLVAGFTYGLFNRFSFLHGASPPGIESGFAYALIVGVLAGPIVFIVGGLLTAAIAHLQKLKKQKAKGI